MRNAVFILIFALASSTWGKTALPKTIAELSRMDGTQLLISLSGRITAVASGDFVLTDKTGNLLISAPNISGWRCGDDVDTVISFSRHKPNSATVYAQTVTVRDRNQPTPPTTDTSLEDLDTGTYDFKPVRLKGTVTEVFYDELDPNYIYAILETDGFAAVLTVHAVANALEDLRRLIDKSVSVEGVCIPNIGDYRRHLDHRIYINPATAIRPLPSESSSADRLPHRKPIAGVVLAPFGSRGFYLKSSERGPFKVYLSPGTPMPAVGTTVRACGFVRKNIFFLSLSNSTVETLDDTPLSPETPLDTSARKLLYDAAGKSKIDISQEGLPVRIGGLITSVSEIGTTNARLVLNCNGISVPVLLGSDQTPPAIGSQISVSGICSITSESDGNPHGFVRLTGFTLLTRGPEDVVILKNPPWWTPAKMLAVIAALAALVIAVLIWNKALRALAERRGRELMDEQLGRVAADLKVNERTRLAVELHDALSQNLTGVSLQLDAVKRFADEDRGKMGRHLDMAMRTLKSCRDELRNCLWDLRNRALEETDMNEAIRRTASPFVGDATLLIRFNVPRDQISDNTAHALMRIIRELATNAVRHGAAKTIRIAGALENGRLLFSVSDDGGGFDPQRHPGVDEGHFGLDGIRERIENLGGSMEIESAPDKGSTIRISMTA